MLKEKDELKEKDGKVLLLSTHGKSKLYDAPGFELFINWLTDDVFKNGTEGWVIFGDEGVWDWMENKFVFATCGETSGELDDIFDMIKSKKVEVYAVKDKKSIWHLMIYIKRRNKISSMEIRKFVEPAATLYCQKYLDKKPNAWIAKQLLNKGRSEPLNCDPHKLPYNYFQSDEDDE